MNTIIIIIIIIITTIIIIIIIIVWNIVPKRQDNPYIWKNNLYLLKIINIISIWNFYSFSF